MNITLKKILNVALFLTTFCCQASTQYLYPVGQLDDENLLMIYQRSLDDLELWIWNRHEKTATKELSPMFLPSTVQLLPSKTAYSFIDRGRVRIKQFNKRAPRAIDIYEPIAAIVGMTWISDEQFYFVGKHEDRFNIFLCDITDRNVTIFCLHDFNDQLDYLYPCKINQTLFCITRNEQNHYAIAKLPFNLKSYQVELQAKMRQRSAFAGSLESDISVNSQSTPQELLLESDKPLCFLSMEHEGAGFVLELTDQNQTSDVLNFVCCKVERSDTGAWNLAPLFSFQLAKKLLVGSEGQRLYESIHPFLPVYTQEWVYFTNYNTNTDQCALQRYNRLTGSTDPLQGSLRSISLGQHCFAPCLVGGNLYCGISCPPTLKSSSGICINEMTGDLQCELPEIRLK